MKKMSIRNIFLIQLLLVGGVSILLVGYLWISSERSKFEKEEQLLRSNYIELQKRTLEREVSRGAAFVNYMRERSRKRLKDSIKSRVYQAHAIATNIYLEHAGSKSIPEIETLVKDALRPVRFDQGRGYYFAVNLKGVEKLFPPRPDLEDVSMLELGDEQGRPVVPDMIAIILARSEGFHEYTWPKPGKEGYSPKISFVKLLEPLGWIIGTGDYLDDMEAEIQRECIEWVSSVNFGRDGYLFAGQWDGLSLSGPATGKNMYEIQDVNGVKIVQELIAAARSGGGFVHYVIPKFEGQKHAPKLSYAVGITDWQWYIGAGMYVDQIEETITEKRLELNLRIKRNIRNVLWLIISLLLFIMLVVKILSDRIGGTLNLFTTFFNRAATETIKIEREKLHFLEFDKLAGSANRMVEKQKKTEKALQASHQRFLAVLDGIDATIYVADMENHEVLFMNKHMKETFGGDMTGRLCWDVFRNGSGPCPHCNNDLLVDEEGRIADVHVWQGKNPVTDKWYINYDRAVEWTDGRMVKLQIATDITEFKKMEEELRQAHKMESIGRLAGGVAHDFNNILSIIIGNVELALDETPEQSPAHKNIREVKTASLRAKEVVRQLLSFSRKTDQNWRTLDIAPVVKESLNLVRSSTPSNIEILEKIPGSSAGILADATQIHQVVINLCTNASHSMADGGRIEVIMEEFSLSGSRGGKYSDLVPGEYLELIIRDTGSGIDHKVIDKIFDPYFTTKDVGQGTGMGLAVVHGIVKNHNGTIFVDSKIGSGTAFHLFFPVAADPAVQKMATPDDGLQTGCERILFVDDESAITEVIAKAFGKLGYEVTALTSPETALDLFEKNPEQFDVVISDMTMPKMNGLVLSEQMKKVKPDIPIVICTGHSSLVDQERFDRIGVAAFAMKPVSMTRLTRIVRTVLDDQGK